MICCKLPFAVVVYYESIKRKVKTVGPRIYFFVLLVGGRSNTSFIHTGRADSYKVWSKENTRTCCVIGHCPTKKEGFLGRSRKRLAYVGRATGEREQRDREKEGQSERASERACERERRREVTACSLHWENFFHRLEKCGRLWWLVLAWSCAWFLRSPFHQVCLCKFSCLPLVVCLQLCIFSRLCLLYASLWIPGTKKWRQKYILL